VFDDPRLVALSGRLSALKSVAVAFSGGTDSSFLLACALHILGPEHVLAVTADSATLPRHELEEARSLAHDLGARHVVVATKEMADPRFAQNSPQRCYYCKQELFRVMRSIADREGYAHLVYGATADDVADYRPGMWAAREAGAMAPLLDASLTKQDVRDLSRGLGLRTWDKPSMACLSSRFPYGTALTVEALARVEQAEAFLRHELGFRQVRVRDQDRTARIEVEAADLPRLVEEPIRTQVVSRLKALNYAFVTLNLEGFRSGSLNDVLKQTVALQERGS